MATLDNQQAQFSDLKSKRYNLLRERQQLHQDLVDGNITLAQLYLDPKNFKEPTIPPTSRMIIDAPVNHIAMDMIIVNRKPKANKVNITTEPREKEADKIERWMSTFVDIISRKQPYFLREAVKQVSFRGECYLKNSLDEHILTDDKFKGSPFRLQIPDSMMVYAPLEKEGCSIVFEERVIYVADLRTEVELLNKGSTTKLPVFLNSLKDTDMVSFVEWWTDEYRGYFAGNVQGSEWQTIPYAGEEQYPNVFGFTPYTRIFSGLGIWTWRDEIADVVCGMLTGLESVLKRQIKNETIISTLTSKIALPLPIWETPEGWSLTKEDLDFSPGAAKQTIKGQTSVSYLMPPPIPQDIIQERRILDQILETYIPNVLRGAEAGGESAIASSARYGRAVLLWQSMYQNITHGLESYLGRILEITERVIKKPVELGGVVLAPKDIEGNYTLNIKIEPGNPDEKKWDTLLGLQVWGKLPRRWIYENYFHIPDATSELAALNAERALEDPTVLSYIIQEAMKEREMRLEVKQLESGTGLQNPPPQALSPGLAPSSAPSSLGEMVPGVGGSPGAGIPSLPIEPLPDMAQKLRIINQQIGQ